MIWLFSNHLQNERSASSQAVLAINTDRALPVVNLRRRTAPGNELAHIADDARVFECVTQSAVSDYDKVFKVNRTIAGRALFSPGCSSVYKFTVAIEILFCYRAESRQSIIHHTIHQSERIERERLRQDLS